MPPRHRCKRDADRVRRGHGAQADAPRARAGRAVLRQVEEDPEPEPVWYAGYGSNLSPDRFRCYLAGGCPPGATRTYPGAREPAEPLDVRPVSLPGSVTFAWESPTWGGGIAFFDPSVPGTARATAYLVTPGQLSDVHAQEMWREPGVDLDLAPLLEAGRHELGPGRYETLHVAGEIDGRPVLTFSAPDVDGLGLRAPAAAYLATMADGLREAHGLGDAEIVDYLLGCPGAVPGWDADRLADAVRA